MYSIPIYNMNFATVLFSITTELRSTTKLITSHLKLVNDYKTQAIDSK